MLSSLRFVRRLYKQSACHPKTLPKERLAEAKRFDRLFSSHSEWPDPCPAAYAIRLEEQDVEFRVPEDSGSVDFHVFEPEYPVIRTRRRHTR